MENSVKALIMGATVLIVLVIIGIGVMILNTSKDMANTANEQIADVSQELSQMKYDAYNGTKVSGSTVMNALRKFKNESSFGIEVATGKNTSGAWYLSQVDADGKITGGATGTWVNLSDEAQNEYVNPSGKFKSVLVLDDSNVVRAIKFTQE